MPEKEYGSFLESFYRGIAKKISGGFKHFHPNLITIISFILLIVVALLTYYGYFLLAGILLLFWRLLDSLDGEVARRYGKTSHYGDFLDEVFGATGFNLILVALTFNYFGLGLFAIVTYNLMLYTTKQSEISFKNKEDIGKDLRKKSKIHFDAAFQSILLALTIIFQLKFFLFLFGLIALLYVLIKFWMFRKEK